MCRGNNNTGANVVNQLGGALTFYSDAGVTVGGGGNLDLNYAGGTNSSNTYNLSGGTLTVPQIVASSASGARIFNFDGGTLKAAGNTVTFMAPGVASAANVRNGGAIIDTAGLNVTIGQTLQHSAIGGDSTIDGGLTKMGNGTLTLSGANTYTGPTAITGGALTLSGGGSIGNSASINLSAGTTFDVSIGQLQTGRLAIAHRQWHGERHGNHQRHGGPGAIHRHADFFGRTSSEWNHTNGTQPHQYAQLRPNRDQERHAQLRERSHRDQYRSRLAGRRQFPVVPSREHRRGVRLTQLAGVGSKLSLEHGQVEQRCLERGSDYPDQPGVECGRRKPEFVLAVGLYRLAAADSNERTDSRAEHQLGGGAVRT